MSDELNYSLDMEIDDSALDVEWLAQPALMYKYAGHAAKMKKEVDDLKESMEVTKALLDSDIRKNPDKYGIAKITESAIQGVITIDPTYQERVAAYNEAQYDFGIATAAVRAMDQRKTALENLVRLLAASYFAGPQVPRDLSEEWKKAQEDRQSATDNKVRISSPSKRRKKEAKE